MTWQFQAARQRVQVADSITTAFYSIQRRSVHSKPQESDWPPFSRLAVVVYISRAQLQAITVWRALHRWQHSALRYCKTMQSILAADAAAVHARQHASCTSSRAALRVAHIAQPRSIGASTKRAAGRFTLRVAAEGNSLEASYSTGSAAGGRSGAAQLREQPAGAAQAPLPLDAVSTPADNGAVLQEAADYMRGELRRMFTTGVWNAALPLHALIASLQAEQQHPEDMQLQSFKQQQASSSNESACVCCCSRRSRGSAMTPTSGSRTPWSGCGGAMHTSPTCSC